MTVKMLDHHRLADGVVLERGTTQPSLSVELEKELVCLGRAAWVGTPAGPSSAGVGVEAFTNRLTGGIAISAGGQPVDGGALTGPHIAVAISYVGDGKPRQLDFGFRPDWVVIKAGGRPAVMYNAAQWYGNIQGFGNATYSGSDAVPPPCINETGVALMYHALAPARDSYNEAGVTYHAVALKDNGAGFFKGFAYNGFRNKTYGAPDNQGATSNPVRMDALDGLSPRYVHIKRDATGAGREGVWVSDDGYVKKESAAAPNASLVTYVAGGALDLSTDPAVNENDAGIIGEAHNCFALMSNPACWGESAYVGGNGATVQFDRPLVMAIILPEAAEEMAFVTATMGGGATGGATALVSGMSINGGTVNVSGALANTDGVTYRVIGIYASSAKEKKRVWPKAPGVILQTGAGRIQCGTDASLQITGAHSLEWIGAIEDTNGEQFIVGRMDGGRGTPAAGSYNFGVAHTRDPDAGIEICTSDQFSAETSAASKQKRWRTGIVLTPFEPVHLLYTHDGVDKWCLYINGELVKWRRLPMSVFGLSGITGTPGLTMAFGGRLAGGTYYASSAQLHKFCRIYNRALTGAEAAQMFQRNAMQTLPPTQSHTDLADIATSLVEEWRFRNGAGTAVTATKVSGNNGLAVNASWMR